MEAQPAYAVTASFWRRLVAVMVDAAVIALVGFGVGSVERRLSVFNLIMVILSAVYFTVAEGAAAGQTLGKRVVSVRVVDDVTTAPIGFARALLRFVVSWASFFVFLLGYLSMLADPAGQTWHDRAAHSIVVPTTCQS